MRSFFYRGRFIFIPLAVAAFLSLAGFVVMSLWNYLMPVIFHLGVITFWQALALFVFCKILFGFGKGGPKGGGPWMRHRMAERFKNMSPEEREKFKEKWGQRCGHGRWGEHHNWDNYADEPAKATE
jgi:hypothetical protein